MFYDDMQGLLRVLTIGVLGYIALVFWLRISGKRTLSKWNVFDFIVTIALGSILASVIISKSVPLFEGILAFVVLIGLQYVITWLSVRSSKFAALIKAEPTLLLNDGEYCTAALKLQRVTKSEIRAAIRGAGILAIEDVAAVVLETDGSFSVMPHNNS
ncbi:MAG: YetF domain-containing protein, partial [Pseudoalteromonas distincta]